jgi:RNA polymerase sigma-70 factor (ECF subfamily)
MEDQDLVRALKNKDEAAYRDLVLAYQEMIVATCYGFLRNLEEAEDVAQEVFIQVFRNIDNFRGEARLSTWIYRIAVNRSLNKVRSRKANLFVSLDVVFETSSGQSSTPFVALENTERAAILKAAIDKLPENQRTAFILSKHDDLANKKVAEVMEMSLSAVEALLNRAKKNLQKHLVEYYRNSQ